MTPLEIRELLSYAAGLDRWLRATDPESADLMVEGWGDMLQEVPLDFARTVCRSHYGQADARTIQPGDILTAWRDHCRRAATDAGQEERRELAAAEVQEVVPGVGSGAAYLREILSVIADGGDATTLTRPAGVPVLTVEQNERARRCLYHAICACTHTECRAGWLDEEQVVMNELGRRYPAVKRCPNCNDALLMAEERGIARKPRRGAPGR